MQLSELPMVQREARLAAHLDSFPDLERGEMFWFDRNYVEIHKNPRVIDIGLVLTKYPEFIDQIVTPEQSPTSARVFYFPWTDSGGDCFMGIKGLRFEQNTETKEIAAHFNWEANNRRDGYNDIAGREIFEQALPEVFTWNELIKKNPYLKVDLQAPFWRPISIVFTGEKIVTQENNGFDPPSFTPDQGVMIQRRFPYTYTRIDEFVEHSIVPESSLRNLDILRRKWGFETNNHVYFRAIHRLGEASSILWSSQLNHNQIFHIVYDPNKVITAWTNFNNIAIDGSIGDLDDSKIINETAYYWQSHHETIGAMIMYLTFVSRTNPELLESREFLETFFDEWKKGIGEEYLGYMKSWTTSNTEYYSPGNAFDHVIEACSNAIEVYSSVDTRPHNTSIYNPTGYLSHHSKKIWMSSLNQALTALRTYRPLTGL